MEEKAGEWVGFGKAELKILNGWREEMMVIENKTRLGRYLWNDRKTVCHLFL